ncbi:unnamed protein product [Effrenium voratum]|nr:unnamed protein product [Effrenium voratum]
MVAAYWRGLPRWIHWWLREAARPKQQLEQIGGLSALGHPPSWSCPGIGSKNILESADGAGASDNHGDETTSLDSPLGWSASFRAAAVAEKVWKLSSAAATLLDSVLFLRVIGCYLAKEPYGACANLQLLLEAGHN